MRKFYGKPAATIKYLNKRKRKRKEFKKRLNAYDYSSYDPLEPGNRMAKESTLHPAPDKFSDEESSGDEYNYYTDTDEEQSTAEENDDELIGYFRLRAFLALMLPIGVSASVGVFLLRQKQQSAAL